MSSRLKIAYEKEIVAKLISKLSLNNKHDVPKIHRWRKYKSKNSWHPDKMALW